MIGGTRLSRVEGRHGGPLEWLVAHLGTPLYRDGYAILLGTGLTSVLGIAYSGRGRAAVSGGDRRPRLGDPVGDDARVRAGSAEHDHDPASVPACRRQFAASLVGLTYAGTLGVTLVLATLAVGVLPRLIPTLGELRELSAGASVLFVAGTLTFTIFSFQDSVLIGLRRAVGCRWRPNLRLVEACAAALVGRPPAAAGNHGFVDRGRRRPRPAGHLARTPAAPGEDRTADPAARLRPIASLLLGNNSRMVLGIATCLRCALVVAELGSRANAGARPWSVFLGLQLVPLLCDFAAGGGSGPGIAPQHPDARDSLAVLAGAGAGSRVPLLLASPLLSLFGPTTRRRHHLARLLALACLPNVLVAGAIAKARLYERPWTVASIYRATSVLGLGLSAILLPIMGIEGAGVAWLAAQSLVGAGAALNAASARRRRVSDTAAARPLPPPPRPGEPSSRWKLVDETPGASQAFLCGRRRDSGALRALGSC